MLSHYELVKDFHTIFGHPVRDTPYVTCFTQDTKLMPFRISLIREELEEFKTALNVANIVEMADALCDLLYVTYGACICIGVNVNYTICEFKEYLKISDMVNLNNIIINKIGVIENNVNNLHNNTSYDDVVNKLHTIIELTYDLSYTMKLNIDELFREVHRSNMSKVCSHVNDAIESVNYYKMEGRYAQPEYRKTGQYYIIYDAVTTKILKNHRWSPPNIIKYL